MNYINSVVTIGTSNVILIQDGVIVRELIITNTSTLGTQTISASLGQEATNGVGIVMLPGQGYQLPEGQTITKGLDAIGAVAGSTLAIYAAVE